MVRKQDRKSYGEIERKRVVVAVVGEAIKVTKKRLFFVCAGIILGPRYILFFLSFLFFTSFRSFFCLLSYMNVCTYTNRNFPLQLSVVELPLFSSFFTFLGSLASRRSHPAPNTERITIKE